MSKLHLLLIGTMLIVIYHTFPYFLAIALAVILALLDGFFGTNYGASYYDSL